MGLVGRVETGQEQYSNELGRLRLRLSWLASVEDEEKEKYSSIKV